MGEDGGSEEQGGDALRQQPLFRPAEVDRSQHHPFCLTRRMRTSPGAAESSVADQPRSASSG